MTPMKKKHILIVAAVAAIAVFYVRRGMPQAGAFAGPIYGGLVDVTKPM